ncbi:MAG: hypothetical protein ACJ72H_31480 [Candidatus Sulfotelmatobacter sp.]
MVHQCPEYANLQQELQLTLQTLSDLTKTMLDAFHGNDHKAFARLDKELGTTVGRKERIVGALRQHVKDHKCSGTEAA